MLKSNTVTYSFQQKDRSSVAHHGHSESGFCRKPESVNAMFHCIPVLGPVSGGHAGFQGSQPESHYRMGLLQQSPRLPRP
jgi:hypothetical protein